MRYFIVNHKRTAKGIDINGARLYSWTGEERAGITTVLEFKQATAKGWHSKKAILVDFPFTVNNEEFVCEGLELTEEVFQALVAKHSGVEVKVYESPRSRSERANAGAWAYVAANYMHDPWDTSGVFGKAICND